MQEFGFWGLSLSQVFRSRVRDLVLGSRVLNSGCQFQHFIPRIARHRYTIHTGDPCTVICRELKHQLDSQQALCLGVQSLGCSFSSHTSWCSHSDTSAYENPNVIDLGGEVLKILALLGRHSENLISTSLPERSSKNPTTGQRFAQSSMRFANSWSVTYWKAAYIQVLSSMA